MKSLLLKEYLQLELADFPQPRPGAGEVLVRVAACGICGSDVHGYDGTSGRRIPPIVMGHEAAGTVTAVGAGVTRFKPGDRVTFDSTIYCGDCFFCRRGEVNLCDNREVIGVSCGDYRRHGAFAEYIAVPERIVYSLPESMSFPEAAMLEAVSVALHAVHVTGDVKGQTALVIGAGMIGLLTMQDEAFNLSGPDLTREILERTGGFGADVVLEAVGRKETIATAIDCVRKGGIVTLIGNITPTVEIHLQKVVSRQIRLQGTAASSGEYPEAIDLMGSGKIRVKPLISAVAPLEEGPQWF